MVSGALVFIMSCEKQAVEKKIENKLQFKYFMYKPRLCATKIGFLKQKKNSEAEINIKTKSMK